MANVPAKLRGVETGRAFWTDEEMGIIEDTLDMPARRVAEEFFPHRSLKSVRHKRDQVKDGWVPKSAQRPWADDEDEFLVSNPHLTSQQAAAALMRSYGSVRGRREVLNKLGEVFGGTNKSPHRVGRRRLVAKTCMGCGLLLDASWFNRRAGGGR